MFSNLNEQQKQRLAELIKKVEEYKKQMLHYRNLYETSNQENQRISQQLQKIKKQNQLMKSQMSNSLAALSNLSSNKKNRERQSSFNKVSKQYVGIQTTNGNSMTTFPITMRETVGMVKHKVNFSSESNIKSRKLQNAQNSQESWQDASISDQEKHKQMQEFQNKKMKYSSAKKHKFGYVFIDKETPQHIKIKASSPNLPRIPKGIEQSNVSCEKNIQEYSTIQNQIHSPQTSKTISKSRLDMKSTGNLRSSALKQAAEKMRQEIQDLNEQMKNRERALAPVHQKFKKYQEIKKRYENKEKKQNLNTDNYQKSQSDCQEEFILKKQGKITEKNKHQKQGQKLQLPPKSKKQKNQVKQIYEEKSDSKQRIRQKHTNFKSKQKSNHKKSDIKIDQQTERPSYSNNKPFSKENYKAQGFYDQSLIDLIQELNF